jgi:hypothetical protein
MGGNRSVRQTTTPITAARRYSRAMSREFIWS